MLGLVWVGLSVVLCCVGWFGLVSLGWVVCCLHLPPRVCVVFTPSSWHQTAADEGHDVSTIFSVMVGSETPTDVTNTKDVTRMPMGVPNTPTCRSTVSLWDYTRQEISPVISDTLKRTPTLTSTNRHGPVRVAAPGISPCYNACVEACWYANLNLNPNPNHNHNYLNLNRNI